MSLQEVRKQRNLSQRECAEHSGINVRIPAFYEQGVRDINGAKLSTLLKLCNTLECRAGGYSHRPKRWRSWRDIYKQERGHIPLMSDQS